MSRSDPCVLSVGVRKALDSVNASSDMSDEQERSLRADVSDRMQVEKGLTNIQYEAFQYGLAVSTGGGNLDQREDAFERLWPRVTKESLAGDQTQGGSFAHLTFAYASRGLDNAKLTGENPTKRTSQKGFWKNNSIDGAVLKPKEPRILNDSSLSVEELTFLKREFLIKKRAIERAANRGELVWSPNTSDVRVSSLQQKYREAVKERFVRRFGTEPDFSKLNADHPVDLVIGGPATQRLKMLNESINKSVGSSLLQTGRKMELKSGDLIKAVEFQKR